MIASITCDEKVMGFAGMEGDNQRKMDALREELSIEKCIMRRLVKSWMKRAGHVGRVHEVGGVCGVDEVGGACGESGLRWRGLWMKWTGLVRRVD